MARSDPLNLSRRYWTDDLGDPAAFFAMTSVLRLARLLGAAVDDVLRAHGLNRNSYLILMSLRLSRDGDMKLGGLAAELLVHPTTVTMTVDRLEADGLVRKAPDEHDRRATRVHLLDAGRDLAARITAELSARGCGLDGLPPRQVESLVQAVTAARRAAGDLPS